LAILSDQGDDDAGRRRPRLAGVGSVIQVLVVCTANVCRSPLAAGLLEVASTECRSVEIHSRGLLEGGRSAPDEIVRVASEYGLDLAAHRSHQIRRSDMIDADLVIGMARYHVREAAILEPSRWPATFTLRELVRRAQATGPRRPREPLEEWLAHLHAGRRAGDLLDDDPADDINDPIGGSYEGYQAMARQVSTLIGDLQSLTWGEAPSP
jgi:protein-tyrosine phosphatase